MSESQLLRLVKLRISLFNLFLLTALIAIGTAIGLALQQNRSMVRQRDELLALSSRLDITSEDELASTEMSRVADDFYSWQVYVPSGQEYELRLGMGPVSEAGVPPIVGSVRISAGRHRVTLHTADSPAEKFRYVVYVDGQEAIEKTMGFDWIPGGWSSARGGISWPREPRNSPAPLQLSSKGYKPKLDFGNGHYFNGQSDNYVTENGYRLWIDRSDGIWKPTSPFIGFSDGPNYLGVGLRDGLRYIATSGSSYHWTFTRPKLNTTDPVLKIAAEFFTDEEKALSIQTPSFQSWQLRNDARGENALKWQVDPAQSEHTAFLQAKLATVDALQPVVEMKWDARRPDEVGLRIAQTPENARIKRWRLRILDGTKHLWRELQIGDRRIGADDVARDSESKGSNAKVALDLGNSTTADYRLRWQTDETLPLQILEREQKHYLGMGLYKGLPLTFGIQIPVSQTPTLSVNAVKEDPSVLGKSFPGGAVFGEIQIDLDATTHDWIWLEAIPQSVGPETEAKTPVL